MYFAVTVYDPSGTPLTEYEPSLPVAAPMVVPSTTTFTPTRGWPLSLSVTVPETEFWANANAGSNNITIALEVLFIIISMIYLIVKGLNLLSCVF